MMQVTESLHLIRGNYNDNTIRVSPLTGSSCSSTQMLLTSHFDNRPRHRGDGLGSRVARDADYTAIMQMRRVCVCVCAYMCVRTCASASAQSRVYVFVCVWVCERIYKCVRLLVCLYVCMHQ